MASIQKPSGVSSTPPSVSESPLEIGSGGVKLVSNSGALDVKNNANNALVKVRALDGTGSTDVVTKSQLDTKKTTPTSFTSSNIAVTQAGGATLAHGLGGLPTKIQAFLECLSDEHGFVNGQRVPISPSCSMYASTARGVILAFDATNIYYRFADSSSVFTALSFSSGTVVTLTNARWELIIKAERDV
jgi:hypothetical protein